MEIVKNLIEANPVICADNWVNRLVGEGHGYMIKAFDQPVTNQQRKIAYVVQTLMYGLYLGLTIGTTIFTAFHIKPAHLRMVILTFVPFGLFLGGIFKRNSEPNPYPFWKEIKFRGDVYASYKTRFKILQPLHKLAFNISVVVLAIFAVYKMSPFGSLAVFANSLFLLSDEVGELTVAFRRP